MTPVVDGVKVSDLFERKFRGDPTAREQLILENLQLAKVLARKFVSRGGIPFEDLVQVATIGLINAIDRFDPARGVKFSTFATPTIIGEIKHHFRDKGWAIRPSRRLLDLKPRIDRAIESLAQQLGRTPTVSEIASFLGEKDEDVFETMSIGRGAFSLDELVEESEDPFVFRGETIGADDPEIERTIQQSLINAVLEAINLLDEKSRKAILGILEGKSQKKLGIEIGCSQAYVSRLQREAINKIKGLLKVTEGA